MKNEIAVIQEHSTGCAVACVAFVLGVTYQKALKLFKNPEYAWGRGYYCPEIVEALQKAGREYFFTTVKSSKSEAFKTSGSIVFVKRNKHYALGHYLARSEDGAWMNPWLNCPRIFPMESGFQARLPGTPSHIIYPISI